MRRLILAAAFSAAAFCATSLSPALAGEQDFKLINKTGYTIDEVYVSRSTSKEWGGDVMGQGTLEPDASVDITFTAPANACRWDLKVKYDDADTAEWSNLNLCNISSVTLFWDRKNQTTRAVTN